MRVAILHDFFCSAGGGEKVVLALAKKYNADIYTYFVEKAMTYEDIQKFRIYQAATPIKLNFIKQIVCARYFEKLEVKQKYDIYLMNGFYSIYAAKRFHPNIWISGAPPKNLFLSNYSDYLNNKNLIGNIALALFRTYFRSKNKAVVRNSIDFILSVSKFQKNGIKEVYGRTENVCVVYPPVETRKFYFKPPEGYYLTVSRLEPLKRVDLIVEAFKRMRDKELVIVGDGPQRNYLERLASGFQNIKFAGKIVDQKELADLYAKCIAFIFMSKFEDFGIAPIEAMAAGKPVIAANEGGPAETISNKRTGILIEPTVDNIIQAVRYLTPGRAILMRNNCRKRARKYDISIYLQNVERVIKVARSSF